MDAFGDVDWIALTGEKLDVAKATASVIDANAGGIDVFIGTTRGQLDAGKGALMALDYDAYPEMAVAQIKGLVAEARGKWPVVKCVVLHRTGRVAVGEASVIIAVSTPHRSEAFEACQFLIDRLKGIAPIWKKDIFAEGEGWHHEPG